ncbi:MAG: hypothetical protein MPW15_29415 (plasmid) [Candidatus Manganitrophus sp.]|nr:hypothetical protein [Candidatus Manganitrophus sp.]MDC4228241.1 hypothetical protein [Candidatus Manganitrophus sp.]
MNSINQGTRSGSFSFLILTLLALSGCGGQSNPPANLLESPELASLEARVFVGNTNGTISVIEHRDSGNTIADPISLPSAPGDMTSSSKNHIFVNMGSLNQTIALDPIGEAATLKKQIAVGQRPTHIVRDPEGSRIWVLNDGAPTPANPPTPDTVTGVDTIISDCNAASTGSVSVIQNHGEGGMMTRAMPGRSSRIFASEGGITGSLSPPLPPAPSSATPSMGPSPSSTIIPPPPPI